ncbi:hypothetical protein Curi_c16980 [Gottschalkia acidurici 9a]|uniref:Uncharacterized protein n=1 Tax=Gottschalkia acidurici (strain ATCC 7906 / DSM 604 / BCRC 14475 / CIP 104303 / KCTC 5404 / NCIMB 10678 / 9a) TaxID=1128398 RepID=K0B172_GOTA9|nr:hypothetical protein Curi_c16980 [Gottschalkia acidurici 9a]
MLITYTNKIYIIGKINIVKGGFLVVNKEDELRKKIDELNIRLEKSKIFEYVDLVSNTRRLLYVNFLGGIARGFGMAIGFTILGAIVIYMLQHIIAWNIPLIGDFIAEIVRIVQKNI